MTDDDSLDIQEIDEEKPKKKTRAKKEKSSFSVTLEDGSIIDPSTFVYADGIKLTQKEILFIFWYTYPDSKSYHCMADSARKAGYSLKSCTQKGYNLFHSNKLAPIIAKIEKDTVKTSIEEAYHRILKRKTVRAEFNGLDFYEVKDYTDENGRTYTNVNIKKPEELTEEQRLCIDGVDFVGQRSIPNYKLPNRNAEENKLIELYEKINGEDNKEGYEVETTAEIIKGNLQIKTKVIKSNSEITELSDLKNKSTERTEED